MSTTKSLLLVSLLTLSLGVSAETTENFEILDKVGKPFVSEPDESETEKVVSEQHLPASEKEPVNTISHNTPSSAIELTLSVHKDGEPLFFASSSTAKDVRTPFLVGRSEARIASCSAKTLPSGEKKIEFSPKMLETGSKGSILFPKDKSEQAIFVYRYSMLVETKQIRTGDCVISSDVVKNFSFSIPFEQNEHGRVELAKEIDGSKFVVRIKWKDFPEQQTDSGSK